MERQKCRQSYIWVRCGDGDDYHPFDVLQEVAAYLREHEVPPNHWEPYGLFGFTAPGFRNNNYISCFVGDDEAQPLTDPKVNLLELRKEYVHAR